MVTEAHWLKSRGLGWQLDGKEAYMLETSSSLSLAWWFWFRVGLWSLTNLDPTSALLFTSWAILHMVLTTGFGFFTCKMDASVPALETVPVSGHIVHSQYVPIPSLLTPQGCWGPKAIPHRGWLTKLDEQDPSGGNHLPAICCHTLEVACVCGVQVSDP